MKQATDRVSEFRTPKLSRTSNQQKRLEQLSRQLDTEWQELRRSRYAVGSILKEVQDILKNDSSFSEFLKAKGIPRSSAYDLIADYKRTATLPQIVREAAGDAGVDLAAKKYRKAIDATAPFLSEKPNKIEAEQFVHKLQLGGRSSECRIPEDQRLSRTELQLSRGFRALVAAVGEVPLKERGTWLERILGFAMHACKVREPLTAKPEKVPAWLHTGRKVEGVE